MKLSTLRTATAALLMAAFALSSSVRPAQANTTSTLLITAAAVAAIATGINVEEKNARANTVVGYLRNGSVVYADGHVVAPNGQSWYPGNYNQAIACNGQYCSIVDNTYNTAYTDGYPAYQTNYDSFVPDYTGYAPAFTGYQYAPGYTGYNGYNGATYAAPRRTINVYKTTEIIHRPAPIVVRHEPIVVRHDPIIVKNPIVHLDPIVIHRDKVNVPVRHPEKPRP